MLLSPQALALSVLSLHLSPRCRGSVEHLSHLTSPKEHLSHLLPSPSQSPPREKAELLHLQKGITDYLQPSPNLCFLQGSLDIATNSCKAHLSQNGLEKWDLAAAGPTGDTRRFPEADTAPKTSHPLPPGMSQTLKGWGCPAATLRGLFGNRFLSPFHQRSAQRRFRGHREGTGAGTGMSLHLQQIATSLPSPRGCRGAPGVRRAGEGVAVATARPGQPILSPPRPPSPGRHCRRAGPQEQLRQRRALQGAGNRREGAVSKGQPEAGFEI